MRKFFLLIIFSLFSISTIYSQASSERLIQRGISLHDRGKYRDAIDYYKQALKINPTSMSATYEMSLSYLHLKDYNNALIYSTKVINSNFAPLLVDAYCVKSAALAEQKKYDQSITLLREAIKRCGDEYLLHYNLGLSYFRKEDLKMALDHLRKAIEVDTTHPSAFLLYAYALADSDKWVQSFFAYNFFLLHEPNTERSKEAFNEMYNILTAKLPDNSPRLLPDEGIDRKKIYDYIQSHKPDSDNAEVKFAFFKDVTKKIVLDLNQLQDDTRKGLLWDFFVPIYTEIMAAGYIDTYCRYISVSYFPTSLEWWNNNTQKVDNFVGWFEDGQGSGSYESGEEELDEE